MINRLAGEEVVVVGHGLESCTTEIKPVIIQHLAEENRRIILVDTPGFDDTYIDNAGILKHIAIWLAQSYVQHSDWHPDTYRVISYGEGTRIAGIVYLQDITQSRFWVSVRRNLDMFRKLGGDEALKNVVLGTTKWDQVKLEVGQRREIELRDRFWKEMIQYGSVIMRVKADSASAWEIINHILKNSRVEVLRIQEELLELQKVIPETDAGRTLLYTLEDLRKQLLAQERTANMGDGQLRQEELEKLRKQIRKTSDDIQKLRVPSSEKIKRFSGWRSGVSQVWLVWRLYTWFTIK